MNMTDETWEEFAERLFEDEDCDECGQGAEGHEPWGIMGNWFAHCLPQHGPGPEEWARCVVDV